MRPEHRRGGIGPAVMEHLARIADASATTFGSNGCALEWNEPALNFYEKLGARRPRRLADAAAGEGRDQRG